MIFRFSKKLQSILTVHRCGNLERQFVFFYKKCDAVNIENRIIDN